MGLFDWISRIFTGKTDGEREEERIPVEPTSATVEVDSEKEEWEVVPKYIAAKPENIELVSVIASSIAAGDYPQSEFKIKSIKEKNPEAIEVSLIASAIAAGLEPESQFVVKTIKKRREIE